MAKVRTYNTRSAKLTTAAVRELFQRLQEGETQGSLAREYGLSVVQVGRIARGESRAKETGAAEGYDQDARTTEVYVSKDEVEASIARTRKLLEGEPPPPNPMWTQPIEPPSDSSVMARLLAEVEAKKQTQVKSDGQLGQLTGDSNVSDDKADEAGPREAE